MGELKGAKWVPQINRKPRKWSQQLRMGARWVRAALMFAFVGLLTLEGWLLWQIWELF
jgi:hypothetical protein